MSPIVIDQAMLIQLLQSLGYAILGSVAYALLGYFKRQDSTETFDGVEFITTLIVGIIAGFAAYFLNITPTQAVTLVLAETGAMAFIQFLVKAIWRRWIQPWVKSQTPAATTKPPATTP